MKHGPDMGLLAPGQPLWPRVQAFPSMWAAFDGTNDFELRGGDLTGNADGKAGTLAFWADFTGGDGSVQIIVDNTGAFFDLRKSVGNVLSLQGKVAGGSAVILSMLSSSTYLAAGPVIHYLASWNNAAGLGHVYINDVSDLAAGATLTDGLIDYTRADWAIGASVAGANKLNAGLAEFWFALSYIDITVAANRRKFITGDKRAVFLGVNGERPLNGVQPIIYQRLQCGAAASTFATNKGPGGDFAITGALAVAPGAVPTP